MKKIFKILSVITILIPLIGVKAQNQEGIFAEINTLKGQLK
jgi:hypothetical protein